MQSSTFAHHAIVQRIALALAQAAAADQVRDAAAAGLQRARLARTESARDAPAEEGVVAGAGGRRRGADGVEAMAGGESVDRLGARWEYGGEGDWGGGRGHGGRESGLSMDGETEKVGVW